MRVKIFSYLPISRALRQGVGSKGEIFATFVPGVASNVLDGVLGDLDGENIGSLPGFGELQSQYFVWRNLLHSYDFVGFEHAARPLFIDPMRIERLRAEFPAVAALRNTFLGDWRAARLMASQTALKEYDGMRAALTDADHARIMRWLRRIDVVVPPSGGAHDPLRREYFKDKWTVFAGVARGFGIFRTMKPDMLESSIPSVCSNSYIVRTELFEKFVTPLFESLFEFRRISLNLAQYDLRYLAERLWGIYLHHARLCDPLLRIAEVPVLRLTFASAPATVPEDFDGKTYMALNPDLVAARAGAASHYLEHGWREDRDWVL